MFRSDSATAFRPIRRLWSDPFSVSSPESDQVSSPFVTSTPSRLSLSWTMRAKMLKNVPGSRREVMWSSSERRSGVTSS